MAKFRRVEINTDIERNILTMMIISTNFCNKIDSFYKPEYFEIDYSKIVAKWTWDFYKKYRQAPDLQIRDIYEVEKEKLSEELQEGIWAFIEKLAEDYDEQKLSNIDFWVDETKKYFRKRALNILFTNGNKLLAVDRADDAEKLLIDYKTISKQTSRIFNPFDIQRIRNFDIENTDNRLFTFPGDLGEMLGWFERGWLVAVMAPEKRGKSWWLDEFTFLGLISKLKVFSVSLEMSESQRERRIYSRLTGLNSEDKIIVIPVFDCKRNQDNTCRKNARINNEGLLTANNKKPEYSRSMTYRTCTECRGTPDFIARYWWDSYRGKKMKNKIIENKVKSFKKMFRDNLRMITFPRFGASLSDVIAQLDILEYSENFRPDVIIIDYLDILSTSDIKQATKRDIIDEIWKRAAGLAASKNCLVITADQADARGREQASLNQTNFSDSKTKDAHLDMRVALNQKDTEKACGVMRISTLFHRHRYFNQDEQVRVLQALEIGQPFLDSCKVFSEKD